MILNFPKRRLLGVKVTGNLSWYVWQEGKNRQSIGWAVNDQSTLNKDIYLDIGIKFKEIGIVWHFKSIYGTLFGNNKIFFSCIGLQLLLNTHRKESIK